MEELATVAGSLRVSVAEQLFTDGHVGFVEFDLSADALADGYGARCGSKFDGRRFSADLLVVGCGICGELHFAENVVGERYRLSDAMPLLFGSIPHGNFAEIQLVSFYLARSFRCLARNAYCANSSELCDCDGSCRDDADDSDVEQRVLVTECCAAVAHLVHRCDGIEERNE